MRFELFPPCYLGFESKRFSAYLFRIDFNDVEGRSNETPRKACKSPAPEKTSLLNVIGFIFVMKKHKKFDAFAGRETHLFLATNNEELWLCR